MLKKNEGTEHINVKNLIKIYKRGSVEVTALRGVNLTVKRGEFLSIVGPSGSGKSTLMNIIGGVSNPTAGQVFINGKDISDFTRQQLVDYRKNTVGFLWQISNLLPDLSVLDNLRLTLIAAGKFKGKELSERIEYLLENAKISHRRNHRPSQISGGELQRAALAVSLANDPEIILADEPTGELDSITGKMVMDYLKDVVNRELGKTLIIVTHSMEIADMADRTVVIHDGVLTGQRRGKEELILTLDHQGKLQLPMEFQRQLKSNNMKISMNDGSIVLQPVEE
ncbi:MAG: ABC transporter ATP-binding protein [Candidatus Hodarchaeales archaeon]